MPATSEKRPVNLKRFLKQTSHYVGASYASRFFGCLRSFVNARVLGPHLYGFWGSLAFLMSFGYHLHGGLQDMTLKLIPTYRRQNDPEAARQVAQLTFSFFLIVLSVAMLGLWGASFLIPADSAWYVKWGLRIAGVSLFLEILYDYERMVSRGAERFKAINASLLVSSFVSLVLVCILVPMFGLAGLFFAAIVTPALGLIVIRKEAFYAWRFRWDSQQIRSLLKRGWPILMMTLVFESLSWVDRFIILGAIGVTGFGYYALGVMIMQLCYIFPEVMAAVIEPKLHFDYAASQEKAHIREHLWVPLVILSTFLPLGIALIDLAFPVFVQMFLPDYLPGMTAIRILIWGSLFMGLIITTKSFIVALERQRRVLKFYLISVALNLVISFTLVNLGYGLAGVALGTLSAYFACTVFLLTYVFHHFGETPGQIMQRIISLFIPAALCFGLSLAIPYALQSFAGPFGAWSLAAFRFVMIGVAAALSWVLLKQKIYEFSAPPEATQTLPGKDFPQPSYGNQSSKKLAVD